MKLTDRMTRQVSSGVNTFLVSMDHFTHFAEPLVNKRQTFTEYLLLNYLCIFVLVKYQSNSPVNESHCIAAVRASSFEVQVSLRPKVFIYRGTLGWKGFQKAEKRQLEILEKRSDSW